MVKQTHSRTRQENENASSTRTDTQASHRPSERAAELLNKNADLFEGLGCLHNRKYDIKTDPNVPPVQSPPRQIPYKIRDKVKLELERMIQLDVIEPVTEPTEWISQITRMVK